MGAIDCALGVKMRGDVSAGAGVTTLKVEVLRKAPRDRVEESYAARAIYHCTCGSVDQA